jgi:hypothetical protein
MWTEFLANKELDRIFGGAAYSPPTTLYLGLWASPLSRSSNGSTSGEIMGEGYARLGVDNNASNFAPALKGSKYNIASFEFPAPETDWGTIKSVAVLDAPEQGNILCYCNIIPKEVEQGIPVRFPPSALRFRAFPNAV